jgi:hypothetical protein
MTLTIKRIRGALSVISFCGFMLAIGSAGAVDCDTIPLWQGAAQAALGLAMFAGSAYVRGYVR